MPEDLPSHEEEERQLSVGYTKEEQRDQIYKSQEIRSRLWELRVPAFEVIEKVLGLDVSDPKLLPTIARTATDVLRGNVVELPSYERHDVNITKRTTVQRRELPQITKEELLSATQDAISAELHAQRRSQVEAVEAELVEPEGVGPEGVAVG